MKRILAFDVGQKKIGIAVTDCSGILASPLATKAPNEVYNFIYQYIKANPVSGFVVGMPKGLDGQPTDGTRFAEAFIRALKNKFAAYPVHIVDERYSSVLASNAIKHMKGNKAKLDEISAVVLLESYLSNRKKLS